MQRLHFLFFSIPIYVKYIFYWLYHLSFEIYVLNIEFNLDGPFIVSTPGWSQGLLYKHLCPWLIDLIIKSPLVKISLRRHHTLMVGDGAFSHKIDNFPIFEENLNLPRHLNRFIGSKVTASLMNGGFYKGVELHRKGSAPAACAAVFIHV